jgi:dephospho-CoA kinase
MSGETGGMARWVVTGPTGAGKSLVSARLAERGADVVDADRVGHELLERPALRDAVANRFGADCLRGGRVDRAALGRRVFGDPAALRRLNELTHPPLAAEIRQRLDDLARSGRVRLAVVEAAVYYLLPPLGPVDLTVAVTAPEELRCDRLVRGGLTRQAARARIAAQRPLEPAFERADVILVNTGGRQMLVRAVDRLLAEHLDPPL